MRLILSAGWTKLYHTLFRGSPLHQHAGVVGDTMGELMLLYGIADLALLAVHWLNVVGIIRWKLPHTYSGIDGAAYF